MHIDISGSGNVPRRSKGGVGGPYLLHEARLKNRVIHSCSAARHVT